MNYLIVEDGGSGALFYETVCRVFNLTNTQVIPTYGNGNMLPLFRKITENICVEPDAVNKNIPRYPIKDADSFIICYDMFPTTQPTKSRLFRTLKRLQRTYSEHVGREIPVYICNYGCIEEVLLSFQKFRAWIHTPEYMYKPGIVDALIALKAYSMGIGENGKFDVNKPGFFSPVRKDCNEVTKKFFDICEELLSQKPENTDENRSNWEISNQERACGALLEHLTFGSDFWFDKTILGTAWQCDCQTPLTEQPLFVKEIDMLMGTELVAERCYCSPYNLTLTTLNELGWEKRDIIDEELLKKNMTARKKLLTLFENSKFQDTFLDVKNIDVKQIAKPTKGYSIKDVLGISHLNAADEENSPAESCTGCRLTSSEAIEIRQKAEEAHQGAGPQLNNAPAWNTYQQPTPPQEPQPPQSSTRGGMRSQARMQQYYTDVGNPYQQAAEAWEQAPQSHNQLPAPAGNPDNIECIATSAFGIKGYLFCTPKGTYGIWKEGKDRNNKPIMVFLIVGLTDEQLITIESVGKISIQKLRAETAVWEQKQIDDYGEGWELKRPVSI